MKIAVCDSDQSIQEKMNHYLLNYASINKKKFQITMFSSGEELLRCEERFDVISLDIEMDNMNGFSPHRAYLINFYHVLSYTSNKIIMDDTLKTEIPISQLKIKEFKELFINYLTKVATQI